MDGSPSILTQSGAFLFDTVTSEVLCLSPGCRQHILLYQTIVKIAEMMYRSVAFITIVATVGAKVYFKENFNDAGWEDRWIASVWKQEVRTFGRSP